MCFFCKSEYVFFYFAFFIIQNIHTMVLVIYCCLTCYCKTQQIEQCTFNISQFLWVFQAQLSEVVPLCQGLPWDCNHSVSQPSQGCNQSGSPGHSRFRVQLKQNPLAHSVFAGMIRFLTNHWIEGLTSLQGYSQETTYSVSLFHQGSRERGHHQVGGQSVL